MKARFDSIRSPLSERICGVLLIYAVSGVWQVTVILLVALRRFPPRPQKRHQPDRRRLSPVIRQGQGHWACGGRSYGLHQGSLRLMEAHVVGINDGFIDLALADQLAEEQNSVVLAE